MTQTATAYAILHVSHQLSAIGLAMLGGKSPTFDPDQLNAILSSFIGTNVKNVEDQEDEEAPIAEGEIDPEWFKANSGNNHLSPKGVQFLFNLWKEKTKPWSAAKRMGIAFRAVQLRYAKFEAGEVP